MSRKPCCDGEGLKKGAWTAEEDKKLIAYIQEHGEGCWHLLPQRAGLKRCGKSCRLRWNNYLKPDIKRGDFTDEEDQTIIKLHASCGNKWSIIARQLPGRTDNEIKNYWNTYLKKRLIKKGIDPVTHKPLASSGSNPPDQETSRSSSSRSCPASLLNRMASKLSNAASNDALSQLFEGGRVQTLGRRDELGSSESFSRSSSTSRLLNKMAGQVTSIKGLLSASVESCSTPYSTTSPPEPIDNFLMGIDTNAISPSYDFEYYMDNYYDGVNSSESTTYSVPMEIDDLDFKLSEVLDTYGNEMYINSRGYDLQDTSSTSFDKDAFAVENWSEFLLEQQSEDHQDMSCTSWEEYYKNEEWSHI